jgi:cytochrome b561
MLDAPDAKYDSTTITLHWATAILVGVLWVSGQTADATPKGFIQTDYWSAHVVLGFALACVLASRLIWRASRGRRLPPSDSGALHFLAEASHWALYGLLGLVVVLGVINAFVRGYDLFGVVSLPQVGDLSWRRPITHYHGLAANILLGLALAHAAAALAHYYLFKDRVLQRMT